MRSDSVSEASPVLEALGSVEQVGVARGVLLYHVFHVVRLQRLSKSLACDKILELHENKTSSWPIFLCRYNNIFMDYFIGKIKVSI